MDRSEQDMARLFLKFFSKEQLSPAETALLKEYLTASMANRRKFIALTKKFELRDRLQDFSKNINESEDTVWQLVQDKLRADINYNKVETPIIPIRGRSFIWIRWAAAAMVIITAGSLLYLTGKKSGTDTIKPLAQNQVNDVLPGSDKATLVLGDGSTIVLDNVHAGVLARQGNADITKVSSGQLTYKATGNKPLANAADETVFNTLRIPKGGQFQLVLPDGSHVWLNAGSSLKYPTVFTGLERTVEMTGEGYFEVAKNSSRPFVVKVVSPARAADPLEIHVLGTHFNVNAYSDEPVINTTLLEGAVVVGNHLGTAHLKPGQQAQVANPEAATAQVNNKIRIVENTDMDITVAWKNGYTAFKETDLPTLMRQVARWYNLEVAFDGAVPAGTFSGKVPRSASLDKVLRILEAADIHFSIVGNKLFIKQ